jgi:hypothetical protein
VNVDRRSVLERIIAAPDATHAERLKAMEQLDRLRDDEDGRGFTRSELDDLSDEELDALLVEPMTIRDTAERIAREIVASGDEFNALVQTVATQMTDEVRAEAQDALVRAERAEAALAQARSRETRPRRQRRSQRPATDAEPDAMHEAEIVALNAWPDEPRGPFGRGA